MASLSSPGPVWARPVGLRMRADTLSADPGAQSGSAQAAGTETSFLSPSVESLDGAAELLAADSPSLAIAQRAAAPREPVAGLDPPAGPGKSRPAPSLSPARSHKRLRASSDILDEIPPPFRLIRVVKRSPGSPARGLPGARPPSPSRNGMDSLSAGRALELTRKRTLSSVLVDDWTDDEGEAALPAARLSAARLAASLSCILDDNMEDLGDLPEQAGASLPGDEPPWTDPSADEGGPALTAETVKAGLERIARDFVLELAQGVAMPGVSLVKRGDGAYDAATQRIHMLKDPVARRVALTGQGCRSLAVHLRVIEILHQMAVQGRHVTKRDIYYMDVELFGSQVAVDAVLDNLAATLAVPRFCLNVTASSKGLFYGPLVIESHDGLVVDGCASGDEGLLIPPTHGIRSLVTTASHVIVIEKDATFREVVSGIRKHKYKHLELARWLVVTGKGYPDITTRRLLKLLSQAVKSPTSLEFKWTERMADKEALAACDLSSSATPSSCVSSSASTSTPPLSVPNALPIHALVDADPHGVAICMCYQFGSMSMAFDVGNLAVPNIQWLGLRICETTRFSIPLDSLLPLGAHDRRCGHALLRKPWLRNSTDPQLCVLRRELRHQLFRGKKAELQALHGSAVGTAVGSAMGDSLPAAAPILCYLLVKLGRSPDDP